MFRKLFAFLLFYLITCVSFAQRNIEDIGRVFRGSAWSSGVVLDNDLIFCPENYRTNLYKFNEISLSSFTYPSVGGSPLHFWGLLGSQKPVLYNSAVYMVLETATGSNKFLYAFNGGSFTRILIPGSVVSNAVVYGGNLYILSNTGTSVMLFRYNGIATEVVGSSLPIRTFHTLYVAGNSLYLTAYNASTGTFSNPHAIKRLSSLGLVSIPINNFPRGISKIFETTTGAVYFEIVQNASLLGRSVIIYYEGGSATTVLSRENFAFNSILYHDQLYVLTYRVDGTLPTTFLQLNGRGSIVEIPFPAGQEPYIATGMTVFGDRLYVSSLNAGSVATIMKFDGTTLTPFFSVPETIRYLNEIKIFQRDGRLLVQPNFMTGNNAYEFNSTGVTEIRAMPGRELNQYLGSNECHHFWGLDTSSIFIGLVTWLGMEPKVCPPPAPPATAPVIPENLKDYVRFNMSWSAEANRECWSELIVNWVPNPVCPIPAPCPVPKFLVQFTNDNSQIAWEQTFSQPFTASVPLGDQTPFKSTISTAEDKIIPLVVMETNLVEKGISRIQILMEPVNNIISVNTETRQNFPVPLKIELLDKNGMVTWTQTFSAPFSQPITTLVQEYGQTLRFSIPVSVQQMMVPSDVTSLEFYPNPSQGKSFLDVKSFRDNIPAEVTIVSLQGIVHYKKRINLPAHEELDVHKLNTGMYILLIKTAQGETKKLIRIER